MSKNATKNDNVLAAQIPFTLFRNLSLSTIALVKSSRGHPVLHKVN